MKNEALSEQVEALDAIAAKLAPSSALRRNLDDYIEHLNRSMQFIAPPAGSRIISGDEVAELLAASSQQSVHQQAVRQAQ